MSQPPPGQALFRALLRHDGAMVAALASVPGGRARFFIVGKGESQEAFVGRVSAWIRGAGASGIAMHQPDVLPEGTSPGEVLLRLRVALGAERADPEALEFDVRNTEYRIDPGEAN